VKARSQYLSAIVVLTSVFCTWESAYAQSATEKTAVFGPAESFGAKRQIAISSDAALNVQRATTSGVSGGTTTLQIAPAVDYFMLNNFSVGGFVAINYVTSGDNHSTRFSIGPRVGYNFALSDLISIWPKVGFSYASTSGTVGRPVGDTIVSTSFSSSNLALNAFVPIMFHPVKHFFVGFGPFLDADLSGDPRTTVWGGKLTLGGWI
jgi:hypothetical protein